MRIAPALVVETTLSALTLGPLLTILPLSAYFSDPRFFQYFGNIIGEISFVLPGLFTRNPWPDVVNANLWTLPAEFWCYAILIACMATSLVYRRSIVLVLTCMATLLVTATALAYPGFSVRVDDAHFSSLYIVLMFMFGVTAFQYADRLPIRSDLFILSAVTFYLLIYFRVLEPLSGIPLTYCMVFLGMKEAKWFDRLLRVDLSYGTYLYGFPITQTVILVLMPYLGRFPAPVRFLVAFAPVVAFTALFAYLSWTWIEKPALSLRRHIFREPPRVKAAANAAG